MADQTIALKTLNPQVDVPAVMADAQKSALQDQAIQKGGLELQQANRVNTDQQQQFSALQNYKAAAGNNDPNAIHQLDSQPEMQKQMYTAFDGQTPQARLTSVQRATDFGQAAQRVAMYQDGTPEKAKAWNDEIDGLVKNGDVHQDVGDALKKQGPSGLLLQEAMTAGDWAKSYAGLNGLKLRESQAKIGHLEAVTKQADARTADLTATTPLKAAEIRGRTAASNSTAKLNTAKLQEATGSPVTGADQPATDSPDAQTAPAPAPAAPPAANQPLAAPPPVNQRVVGKVYVSPKGPMQWTPQGWLPVKQ